MQPQSPTDIPAATGVLQVQLFGKTFTACTETALNELIARHLRSDSTDTLVLANHNLHSLALCRNNEQMQDYYDRAEYHWLDGMPVVWMLKLLGYPVNNRWRTTFLDWDKSFLALANSKGWRIFILGASKINNQLARAELSRRYPKIVFGGCEGYINSNSEHANDHSWVTQINHFQADILFVGMGMPRQEIWLGENLRHLKTGVVMPLGGYFDYLAGDTFTPPRWTGKLGLEWLVRLIAAPRRLGFRYLIEPWPVIFAFVYELVSKKLSKSGS